jgi:four helix bundle protein
MNHTQLKAWQEAIELSKELYLITAKFPAEERYGITSQIRRSAVSVPANIAEGSARGSKKEMLRFLFIAMGSLAELETLLLIAFNIGYLTDFDKLNKQITRERSLIIGLQRAIKQKITEA